MREKVRLICVTDKNNKFYEMEDLGTAFTVKYGKIGTEGQQRAYGISLWDKKYNEKINKGYIDVSKTIEKFSLDDIFANLDLLEERLKNV